MWTLDENCDRDLIGLDNGFVILPPHPDTEEVDDSSTRMLEETMCDAVHPGEIASMIDILFSNSKEEHDVNPKCDKNESVAAYFSLFCLLSDV